jgi:hypothetical protein
VAASWAARIMTMEMAIGMSNPVVNTVLMRFEGETLRTSPLTTDWDWTFAGTGGRYGFELL